METGIGIARGADAAAAGARATRRALDEVGAPDLIVAFVSAELDQHAALQGIKRAAPGVPVFGCSSYAEISSLGATRGSIVTLAVRAPELAFELLSIHTAEPPEETARRLIAPHLAGPAGTPARPTTCVLAGADFNIDIHKHLESFNRSLPFPLPISGGGAARRGGELSGCPGYQYVGDQLLQDHLGLLLMKAREPDAVRFGYAYSSCWQPLAHEVTCTRADGNLVFEVDDMPIVDYMKSYLGPGFQQELQATAAKYTFIEALPDDRGCCYVVRSPMILADQGAVAFYPKQDMKGVRLQLAQATRTELAHATTVAAERAKEALDGFRPALVLAFSCLLRRGYLHSRKDEEVRRIQEVFGPEVPVVGFYAGCEFSPIYNRYQDVVDPARQRSGSTQYSTSISLLALGTRAASPTHPDAVARLRAFMKADHAAELPADPAARRVEELVRLLTAAESMSDETENTLKRINREHFTLAAELKRKNEELAVANRRNQKLQRIVRQYTPHKVWRKALASADAGYFSIPDEEAQVTLMFMDVKGFTRFAESHAPAEVIRELNRIFEPATAILYDHGGDVDKFIGDCIFASFPAPGPAVDAALEVLSMVRVLATAGSPFNVRVGINMGRVISGNVGGSLRRDNTVIGDAVNLAQRLEAACTPGRVLVSKPVWLAIKPEIAPDLPVERREVTVKGKELPVECFEIDPIPGPSGRGTRTGAASAPEAES